MKTIRFVILSLAFLFGMVRAQVTELPIGGLDRVMKYSLENSKEIFIRVFQGRIEVGRYTEGNPRTFPKFKSKLEVDTYFAKKFAIAANSAVNLESGQDKDKPFTVWARLQRFSDAEVQFISLFTFDGEFSLIRSENGSYKLPDLSGIKLDFPPEGIGILIPNLKWARIETANQLLDSTFDTNVILHGKVLVIPLEAALGLDTTIRIISGTNYTYQVFGPDGKPQVEEPVRLILGSYPVSTSQAKKASDAGQMFIEVQGGGIGRVLQLQQSITPQGPWSDIEDGKFTRWSSESVFKSVETTPDEKSKFYRVRLVNEVPTYGE